MHAEKCPVCDGEGKINQPRPNSIPDHVFVECHGCNGRGWVEVRDDIINIPSVWIEPWQAPYGSVTTTFTPDNDSQWSYTYHC